MLPGIVLLGFLGYTDFGLANPVDHRRNTMSQVILITGASSGFGQACATRLAERGHKVFGTTRRPQQAPPSTPAGLLEMIPMDVDDEASVNQAVNLVLEKQGRLDVVVNNAGWALAGAVEQTSIAEAKALFETNVWGALRVCRAVLPTMRAQGSGYIVNVSSIGGLISVPFQGLYCASKFALEGLMEALRMEVRPFGVHVVLVEPGDARTRLTANRHETLESQGDGPYAENFRTVMRIVEHDETHGFSADQVARLVERIIQGPSPRLRYRVGALLQKSAVPAKKILPGAWFEWIIMRYYKLV
jgi:NAD(P)-dependent dehydrogenase (short-subunit alcohol dehydrogenase family)